MTNGWTPERRLKQALLIKTWQPWCNSTGPRTSKGKMTSSQNAFKGNLRQVLKHLGQLLKQQEIECRNFNYKIGEKK